MRTHPEFAGWLLAPEGPAGSDARVSADGRRAFILRGVRFLDHPDGSIERAREVFQEEDVKAIELPPRLGGGFLFHVNAGSSTSLWRAQSWTADLRPLGRIEPPTSAIHAGFDRLYLESATSHGLRAIDPFSGKALDLSPLPKATAYGDMEFADAWHAVVLAGVRGALATFDAGESWHAVPTPEPVNDLARTDQGRIVLGTEAGRFELDESGRLSQTSAQGSDALFRDANTFTRYARDAFPAQPPKEAAPPPLGARPLRAAVLRGIADTAETAVVIERGVLARVRLKDGKLLSSEPYSGREPCRGVALGPGIGFICGDAHGPTEVYAHRNGRLELELRVDEPVAVSSNGNGALVMRAPCSDVRRSDLDGAALPSGAQRSSERARREADVKHYCVRQLNGDLFDVRVRGDVGSERIAALRDGRVAVLIPPRAGASGRLSIVTKTGTAGKDLSLAVESGAAARLVRSGLWLDELWEVGEGLLGAWVVGARAFVGVHIDLEGVVQTSRLQEGVDETSFAGSRALSLAGSASQRETTNHGFDWIVSEVPPALSSAGTSSSVRRPLRGCSSVGCVHGDWVRVGFSDDARGAEPIRPEPPPRVAFPTPGFAFWTLSCEATGRGSKPARRRSPAPAHGASSTPRERTTSPAAPESSAWLGFQGSAAPQRKDSDVGYDFGETNEYAAYRAYVWGPSSGDWGRHGTWQLRVGDRFSAQPPWSTQVTRSPWKDPVAAAQAFGLDPSTGVDWWLRVGATGDSGVLQIRVRSESSVHLIDRERSIMTLAPGSTNDLGTLAGAHQVEDTWYLGASRAEQFQLYRVEQGRPQWLATYPLWGRIVTQLVRSVHGDELAIWQKSTGFGWYLFPIDLETFSPGPALFVPIERLGTVPPACEPERPGWLAVAGVPLTESAVSESNTHLDFTGGAEGLRTKRLTARLVVDESGVCVDALAALSEGSVADIAAVGAPGARARSLPLTVTDSDTDARWTFTCEP